MMMHHSHSSMLLNCSSSKYIITLPNTILIIPTSSSTLFHYPLNFTHRSLTFLHPRHHAPSSSPPSAPLFFHFCRTLRPLHHRHCHQNLPKMYESPNPTSLHCLDFSPSQCHFGPRLLRQFHFSLRLGRLGNQPLVAGDDRSSCSHCLLRPKLRPDCCTPLHS